MSRDESVRWIDFPPNRIQHCHAETSIPDAKVVLPGP